MAGHRNDRPSWVQRPGISDPGLAAEHPKPWQTRWRRAAGRSEPLTDRERPPSCQQTPPPHCAVPSPVIYLGLDYRQHLTGSIARIDDGWLLPVGMGSCAPRRACSYRGLRSQNLSTTTGSRPLALQPERATPKLTQPRSLFSGRSSQRKRRRHGLSYAGRSWAPYREVR